jgi:HK97 family phage major capsid protein
MSSIVERSAAYERAQARVQKAAARYDAANTGEEIAAAGEQLDLAVSEADAAERALNVSRIENASRGRIEVSEPDMYSPESRSFLGDLYMSQMKGDLTATDRLTRHQNYELEKRAITTGTLGGLIPPQYLVDMYAKAARNGRIFADQVNRSDPLPDTGMTLIVPRLTQGTAAAVQATENNPVTTQDVTETDLDVPVRTIGGYVPVSRQTLDRAAYSEAIIFEDLIARYFAALDTSCLNGLGTSGDHLGVLQTSGVVTSSAPNATLTNVWPKIADVIQQINSNVEGLGYMADKVFMHPAALGLVRGGARHGRPPDLRDQRDAELRTERRRRGRWVRPGRPDPRAAGVHGREHPDHVPHERRRDHHHRLPDRALVGGGGRPSVHRRVRAADRHVAASPARRVRVLRLHGWALPGGVGIRLRGRVDRAQLRELIGDGEIRHQRRNRHGQQRRPVRPCACC